MTRPAATPQAVIGIDVETANPQGAVCEFAAVAIDCATGATLFTVASLVDPGDVHWHPMTARVHGIRRDQVAGKPRLPDIWRALTTEAARAGRARFFAHNASAERSWIARGLGKPLAIDIECTLALARRSIALGSYRLPAVCEALGIPFTETHRATADATAAARIARCLLTAPPREAQTPTTLPTARKAKASAHAWTSNESRGSNQAIIASTRRISATLSGLRVCITGQFECGWTRKDAKAVIVAHGGTPLDAVSGGCNLLIMAGRTGRLTSADFVTGKATEALARGVRVISETEFQALVGE